MRQLQIVQWLSTIIVHIGRIQQGWKMASNLAVQCIIDYYMYIQKISLINTLKRLGYVIQLAIPNLSLQFKNVLLQFFFSLISRIGLFFGSENEMLYRAPRAWLVPCANRRWRVVLLLRVSRRTWAPAYQ